MCGRFTQHYTWKEMHDQLDVFGTPQNLKPNWNVAPTQSVDVVLQLEAGRSLTQMHWGLLPFWAKDRKIASRMSNARSETVAEKPAFRKAFADRRCVVPASGFYEWKREGKDKQPYYITTADGSILCFAGIYESWTDPETKEDVRSVSILTTEPNALMASIHNRMPVILGGDQIDSWLTDGGKEFLKPCPPEMLNTYPVSDRVNKVANNDASIVEMVERN